MRDGEDELGFKLALNELKRRARRLNCPELLRAIDNIVTVYWKIYKRKFGGKDRYADHDFDHINEQEVLQRVPRIKQEE